MSIIGNHISGAIEAVKGADGTSHEINAAYLDGKSSSTYAASSDLNDLKSTVNGRARVYVVDNLAPSSTDTTTAYINSKLTASPDANRTITWTDGRYVLNPGGGSSGGGSGGSIRSTNVQSASGDQRRYWYLATVIGSSYEMNVTFQNGTKGYGSWHVVATCSADPSASTGGYGSQIVVGVGNITSSGFLLSARRWNNSYTPPTKWVIHWIAVKYY